MGNMGTPVVVIGNYFRFRVLWYVTEGSPRNNKYTEHQQALICIEVTAVPKTIPELEDNKNVMIRDIIEWLEKFVIEIAAHKTEFVLLRSKQTVESMRVGVKGLEIPSAVTLQYMGVLIDRRLSSRILRITQCTSSESGNDSYSTGKNHAQR